jgi:hypothetical protein
VLVEANDEESEIVAKIGECCCSSIVALAYVDRVFGESPKVRH